MHAVSPEMAPWHPWSRPRRSPARAPPPATPEDRTRSSFDSSIIPAGGGSIDSPATSGFNFTWDGTSWDDSNASIGALAEPGLVFDSGGQLVDWNAFGDPNLVAMLDGDDFILDGVPGGFFYIKSGSSTLYIGTVSWTTTTTTGGAPEPASWLLLGSALVGLVGMRKRTRE